MIALLLVVTGFVAGVQNALAGGGSFLTLPVLMLAGMDARAANITSTLALFPGQIATGVAGRGLVRDAAGLSLRWLVVVSLVGGGLGAWLLLATPRSVFAVLVPWLVLFATGLFAWGSFRRPSTMAARLPRPVVAGMQTAIAIYGGYFGGGIGILMLAALSMAGLETRFAAGTKNVLAAVINIAAVVIFAFSPDAHWIPAILVGVGSIGGGQMGAWLLQRVNERWLRIAVIVLGIALTVGLFLKAN